MAETLVKDKVCGECGSEVRPDTLFCFHCGSALGIESDESDESEVASDEPSDVWFKSEIATPTKQGKSDKTVSEKQDPPVDEQEEEEASDEESNDDVGESTGEVDSDLETKPEIDESHEVSEKEEEEKNSVKPKPFKERIKGKKRSTKPTKSKPEAPKPAELKSAAAIRKREKPTRLKKVEIVWEERGESPNISFVIFAIFLSLLVAGLVFIAFYLK